MAYNFKNLADVELLSAMPETANMLVEVNGTTKRAPKAADVDVAAELIATGALEEVPEGAEVLGVVNGEIKRIPGAGLGGSGVKTAIIKASNYDNALAGLQTATAAEEITYECINMTFEEAYEIMASGQPLNAIGMFSLEGAMSISGLVSFLGSMIGGVPCIAIWFSARIRENVVPIVDLYWTADGLSTSAPGR